MLDRTLVYLISSKQIDLSLRQTEAYFLFLHNAQDSCGLSLLRVGGGNGRVRESDVLFVVTDDVEVLMMRGLQFTGP